VAQIHRHRGQSKKLAGAAAWWAAGCPGLDVEESVQQLRAEGWPEDAIEAEYAEAARLVEAREVWPENWIASQVFLSCQWTRLMGFEKTLYEGISTQEIVAAMLLHRVPRKDWPDTAHSVRVMIKAARPVLNSEAG